MLAQEVRIEDEQNKTLKNQPEPQSMKDIQVFLSFANFHWYFIQSFSKITGPLSLMLQISSTIRSSKNSLLSIDMAESDEFGIGSGGDYKDGTVKRSTRSKNLNRAIGYLTSDAGRAFIQLRQAFTKALILWHFDPKCYIRIELMH